MASPHETLMTFPCTFPLKVMGLNSAEFEANMLHIVAKYMHTADRLPCQTRPSKTGKYVSLTITFIADSKVQLDKIYHEVTSHPDVKMVL